MLLFSLAMAKSWYLTKATQAYSAWPSLLGYIGTMSTDGGLGHPWEETESYE